MKIHIIAVTAVMSCVLAAVPPAQCEEMLSWQECVMYTLTNNPELRSSQELIQKNKAGVGIARSAYLPQISAGADISASKAIDRTETDRKEQLTMSRNQLLTSQNKSSSTITNTYSYGLSGKQLIFDGMKTVYDIKSAKSAADDALYQYLVKSAQVRFDLRTAYVKLLKAQETVGISNQIIEIRKKNYNLVKMRYLAGREHKGSLMSAEANLEQAKYSLRQAERNITAAQRSLLTVMGIYSYQNIKVKGTLSGKPADREKPNFESIVKSHPAILEAGKQREVARYNEKSRIASFFPVISATGSADQTLSETTGSNPNNVNLKAGLSATMPLFTGGNSYYNLEQAKAQSRKLEADEASVRDQVILNLEQYWINWQNAIDAVGVQRKYLSAAEERARIAEAEYSLGLVVFDIWITIEDQLVQMKQSYLESLSNELLAEAQWIQAKGETLAYDK